MHTPPRTPLMLACTKDDVETVRLLVENGASLSLRNKDGWTSFHIACRLTMGVPKSSFEYKLSRINAHN